jgi:putative Mg2+ transporter-C (MgtC) family protein
MTTNLELIVRIATGAALGAVIGYERHLHRRQAGLRTHLLVAMTAATFTVVSTHFVYWQHYGKDDFVEVDASRIAASVVSAVGFLAGGAILRTNASVQGLTTAAGLWLVTAIGMCAGAGMYAIAVFVTATGLATLTVLRRFEAKDDNLTRRRIAVVLGEDGPGIDRVVAALASLGATMSEVDYERRLDEGKKRIEAAFDVHFANTVPVAKIIESIESLPGVRRVKVTQSL